jgi:hypothetical protein
MEGKMKLERIAITLCVIALVSCLVTAGFLYNWQANYEAREAALKKEVADTWQEFYNTYQENLLVIDFKEVPDAVIEITRNTPPITHLIY